MSLNHAMFVVQVEQITFFVYRWLLHSQLLATLITMIIATHVTLNESGASGSIVWRYFKSLSAHLIVFRS